jgi:hypothetical protein
MSHRWQVKTCFLWNTALSVGRKINTRYTTYFTIPFQCFLFLTHLRFPNSQFHDSISVVPIALLHCIFIHFDFIISCDTALELSCVVYHSVHFVSIVYFFLFPLFSISFFNSSSFFSVIRGGIELCRLICVWIKILIPNSIGVCSHHQHSSGPIFQIVRFTSTHELLLTWTIICCVF